MEQEELGVLERKRLEEEERKRLEEEAKRREEEEKRRQEEEKRLAEQQERIYQRQNIIRENRQFTKEEKIKKTFIEPKYLECDPLPDPHNEKELTTYITLWKKQRDENVKECIHNCQTSENIIRNMLDIYGSALANYNQGQQEYCIKYMKKIRKLLFRKYDQVCSKVLEYIEKFIYYTEEEKKNMPVTQQQRKDQNTTKPEFYIKEKTSDIKFGIWGNVQGKSFHHKKTDFEGLQCGVPRNQSTSPVIMRVLWTSFDYLTSYEYYPDIVVGGILDFTLFQYPEYYRMSNKWTMRNMFSVEDRLKKHLFPDPQQPNIDQVGVVFILPEYIYITENDEINIGVWDEETKQWQVDPIGDLSLDKQAKKLEFTTKKLAPMAFIQPRTTDFPYKSWKLRCIEDQKALLDIQSKRLNFNLTFEIGPQYCMLIEKNDQEFKDIVDKKMLPGRLFIELSRCGVHLMPDDQDIEKAGITLKDRGAEEKAIFDISNCLRSFAFRSSKWNKHIKEENIVMKIRENLEYDREFFEDHEPDWNYIMYWNNKCAFVRTSDADESLNTNLKQGHETQAMLPIAIEVKQVCNQEAVDRCSQYHVIEFLDTIIEVLRITRILSFT